MSKDPNKKYTPDIRALKRFHICSEREDLIGVCGDQPTVQMDVTFYHTPKRDEVLSFDTCPTDLPHSIRLRVKGDTIKDDIWFSLEGGFERLKEIVQQIESLQERLSENDQEEP